MKILLHPRVRQAGYSALFITMVMVTASVLVMGATLARSTSNTRLNDRNALYVSGNGAAEAAVEKVIARMMVDFASSGEGVVISNIPYYETSLLPTTAENPYWSNFVWSDGQGNDNQIYVVRRTTSNNAPFVALEQQYTGLSGYASTYQIIANVRTANTSYNYNFTNAVLQEMQLAQIPVFQFAIFYNSLLEFSDTATLTINGPVHANSNIYVGSPANLTFNSIVTTTGNITAPANAGFGTSSWTGTTTYNGTPRPGYLTGQPSLTLPIGSINGNSMVGTNIQQIIYPPPAGEDPNSPMGQQRYFNKAGMVITVSNSVLNIALKSSATDPSPVFYTNISLTTLTWNYPSNCFYFLNTTNTFKDWREGKTVDVTQIDIGKLTNWMQTNVYVYSSSSTSNKFSANNPLNIIYICDWRTTNSSTLTAIRLANGLNLPAAGLTVATPNPLYILGNYNCPVAADLGTTNTANNAAPASVACDALTILSPAWADSGTSQELHQTATSDTVNTAIIAGIVASTGTGASQYSGGANNLPRLLEDWRSATLTLNTSIVCLFNSTWATGPFVLPGTYYYAPQLRQFSFDQNYTQSSKMPPGTPNICRLIRAAWCNPVPDTNSYPSVTMDFVPH